MNAVESDNKIDARFWYMSVIAGTRGPINCEYVPFDVTKLGGIKKKLEVFWPSLDPSIPSEVVWDREVREHGSCAICQDKTVHSGTLYLKLVLALNEMRNISALLIDAGVIPNNERTVSLAYLRQTLVNNLWTDGVELNCDGKRNGKDILQEINICLNATKYFPTGCPSTTQGTCQTPDVWYLESSSRVNVPRISFLVVTVVSVYFTTIA